MRLALRIVQLFWGSGSLLSAAVAGGAALTGHDQVVSEWLLLAVLFYLWSRPGG